MNVSKKSLIEIERCWSGPMANDITTRVRFAMWDAMRLAASLAKGECRKRILGVLRNDERLMSMKIAGERPIETATPALSESPTK